MNRTGEYLLRALAIWATSIVIGAIGAAFVLGGDSFLGSGLEVIALIIVMSGIFSFPAPFVLFGAFYVLDRMHLSTLNKKVIIGAIGSITCFVALSVFGLVIEEMRMTTEIAPIYIVAVIASIAIWTINYDRGQQNTNTEQV